MFLKIAAGRRAAGWLGGGGGGGGSVVVRAEGNRGEDIGSDFCVF